MQNSARGPLARARADPLVLSWIQTDTDELCSCCSRIRSRQGVCIEIPYQCIAGGESSRERARAPNFPSRNGPTGLSLISLNYSRHQSLTPHSPDTSSSAPGATCSIVSRYGVCRARRDGVARARAGRLRAGPSALPSLSRSRTLFVCVCVAVCACLFFREIDSRPPA